MNRMATDSHQEVFLTPPEAARFLNLSVTTLKKLIYLGKVSSLKTPGGHHRIPKSSLMALLSHKNHASDKLYLSALHSAYEMLKPLVSAFESRVSYHRNHSLEVAKISLIIARRLGYTERRLAKLKIAALLHDIGLIRINEDILNKPFPLLEADYNQIKRHPLEGESIVRRMRRLNGISTIILQHHERYDGLGYPSGLKADDILQEARIIHLAESYVTMTSAYSYKPTVSKSYALKVILSESSRQFDPQIVDLMALILRNER